MRRLATLARHLAPPTHDQAAPAPPLPSHAPGAPTAAATAAASPAQLAPLLPDEPPSFQLHEPGQTAAAIDFFHTYGFVVIEDSLSESEIAYMNDWYERTQRLQPEDWGCQRGAHEEWLYHQPLLEYEEMDGFVRHGGHYPLVAALLGGEEHARFSEFDFRETPAGTAQDRNWHRDIGPHGFGGDDPAARHEYMASRAHDYICSFHYLSDVTPESPSFGVIPQSCVFAPLPDAEAGGRGGIEQLRDHLGDKFQELPLYCKAGTCCLYDISLYHSRVNASSGARTRRALQTYYSRGDVPALTNWVILPQRLAEHPDHDTQQFYSLQCEVQCQIDFAASGYDHKALSPEDQNRLRVGEYAYVQPDGDFSGT
jgi:ectoine hydroxylase-related dioxygenase (phytanoyl-CoA dioxygenase family)